MRRCGSTRNRNKCGRRTGLLEGADDDSVDTEQTDAASGQRRPGEGRGQPQTQPPPRVGRRGRFLKAIEIVTGLTTTVSRNWSRATEGRAEAGYRARRRQKAEALGSVPCSRKASVRACRHLLVLLRGPTMNLCLTLRVALRALAEQDARRADRAGRRHRHRRGDDDGLDRPERQRSGAGRIPGAGHQRDRRLSRQPPRRRRAPSWPGAFPR